MIHSSVVLTYCCVNGQVKVGSDLSSCVVLHAHVRAECMTWCGHWRPGLHRRGSERADVFGCLGGKQGRSTVEVLTKCLVV